MNKKNKLEKKILELENKKAEMEEEACYVLAELLEKRIKQLKSDFIHC